MFEHELIWVHAARYIAAFFTLVFFILCLYQVTQGNVGWAVINFLAVIGGSFWTSYEVEEFSRLMRKSRERDSEILHSRLLNTRRQQQHWRTRR